jgi:hypothetical protein
MHFHFRTRCLFDPATGYCCGAWLMQPSRAVQNAGELQLVLMVAHGEKGAKRVLAGPGAQWSIILRLHCTVVFIVGAVRNLCIPASVV